MVDQDIVYRQLRPSDIGVLERIHCDLFPIRYESEFFHNAVSGRDIVSWGAVDCSRTDGRSDELVGFVTARTILANDSEIGDMLRYDPTRTDQTLVYILTLGVVESYRNRGIAAALTREVIKYASNLAHCQAVYLHVISYNNPAIQFYKKLCFKFVRRLSGFYYIQGQHYDSLLFVYYVNGGRSPCSPLDIVATVAAYVRSLFKLMVTRLWKSEEKVSRWSKCKESRRLLTAQNKRNITSDSDGCQCV
ncbi:hypothetical protein MKW98_024918 [Papaver atlanticum]|uniref:N-alpha-acetyltransferase 60 n=1 Tax=Papaver atlanticum TaxID=357466 RepID=A0AAD4T7E0_9MAGN|nr:hypothetical protein MKW98_024918 [Papaver atlanticum]